MLFKKLLSVVFITTLMIGALAEATQATPEIVVGTTVSMEGKYKAPSLMIQLSYRLWEKQINEAGGLLGSKVRLVFYDDKSRKDLVRIYYSKMIVDDKVDLVLAPYGTDLSYVASEVTERHGYVLLASAASGEMIWDRGYRYVFGVYSLAKRYFIGFLDLAARNRLQSVAILNDDALFTKDAAKGAYQWAQRLGMQVMLRRTFADGHKAFPDLIQRLETIQPEVVVLVSYPPDGYQFLEQLKKSRYRPKALALSITPSLPDFHTEAGVMADGTFGPSQWEPDERITFPGTHEFIGAFHNNYSKSPSYHAGAAYAGCQLLQKSVEYTGKIDHLAMRDYISALDTVTVIGRFKVDPKGRQIGHNTIIIQWQKGKKEIVYPSKMQTATPNFNH